MTDYEILTLMISIIGVIFMACTLLLEVIKHCSDSESKKDRPSTKRLTVFFS